MLNYVRIKQVYIMSEEVNLRHYMSVELNGKYTISFFLLSFSPFINGATVYINFQNGGFGQQGVAKWGS